MHHMPSRKAVIRMRIAAALICMLYVMTPVAVIIFLVGFYQNDNRRILAGLALAIATVLVLMAQWICAAQTYCPLCMTPVLMRKGCAKHRKARRFLGSYRLRVALSVLFTGRFRCTYCGEPSVLKVRERDGS